MFDLSKLLEQMIDTEYNRFKRRPRDDISALPFSLMFTLQYILESLIRSNDNFNQYKDTVNNGDHDDYRV